MSEATVIERFGASLERDPDATAITLIASGGHAERLTYAGLFDMARRAASGLESLALRRGGVVVLSMPASKEILAYYLACLGTGVIPLIASGSHRANAFPSAPVLTLDGARDRMALGEKDIELRADPDGIAHLQSTSGSTGVPKTAVIRHRNVSANVRAIGQAIGERDGDSVVSWLPLYHDMGLICVSCVLFWQRPFVLTDAANFVRHPIRYWLQLISTFRATISPAPASAYQVCARLAKRRSFEELDLSTWRVGFCGAEPVHPRTVTDFQERFAPYGLPPTTLLPVYGLAEATLAVTIPERDSRPRLDVVDGPSLEGPRHATPAMQSSRTQTFVSVGRPLAGHTVDIVDGDGQPLPERCTGEIEVSGPSVIDGYWEEPFPASRLQTGDIGYMAGGELFVTGRSKDIIIIRGRNLLPSQIELVVEDAVANGIQNGVAAVGLTSETEATEELHLLIESREVPPSDAQTAEERIREAVASAFEIGGTCIHWLRKGSIPKTPSGKIQRSRCRELAREPAGVLVS